MATDEERRALARGKYLVVIGAGAEEKRFILEKVTKKLGVNIILVDKADSYGAAYAKHVIAVDNSDVANVPQIAEEKIKTFVAETGIKLDGIYNFWENDVQIASDIASRLGLPFNSKESGAIAKSKQKTREFMAKAGLRTPKFFHVKTAEELEVAIKDFPWPAVLKPVYGACAQGASKVNSSEEARAAFATNLKVLNPEFDSIYTHGVDHVLEQYLDGDEVDVDIVLQDGKVKFKSITDNLPTYEPDFTNTGANLPSTVPADKQEELIDIASRTAIEAIGMTMGAAHIEMKYTTHDGPHIIEVNARVCGGSYPLWIEAVWGVDIIEQCVFVALGIPIAPVKAPKPLKCLAASYILSDGPGEVTEEVKHLIEGLAKDPRVFEADAEGLPVGYKLQQEGHGREELGIITAQGKTLKEAIENFEAVTDPENFPLPDCWILVAFPMLPIQLEDLTIEERQRRRSSSVCDYANERTRRRSSAGLSS